VPSGAWLRAWSFARTVLGVGVVEVGEDVQGVLPSIAGGVGVAGGVVGIAEPGEKVGFLPAAAEVSGAAIKRTLTLLTTHLAELDEKRTPDTITLYQQLQQPHHTSPRALLTVGDLDTAPGR